MALKLGPDDLVENPTPRVPVSLCIDTSSSMTGDKIRELVRGVNAFYDAVEGDDDARDAAEISIVEFNSGTSLIQDFASVDRLQRIGTLSPVGLTAMGEGVNLALDTLEDRKAKYSGNGVLYYQPWLVLMTDGTMVTAKKLTVFPIGIGADADMTALARFSPNRRPLRLKGLNFKEFFEWLSRSVSRVSRSTPGDAVKLDPTGLDGWAEL